jgi:hypothetical protein
VAEERHRTCRIGATASSEARETEARCRKESLHVVEPRTKCAAATEHGRADPTCPWVLQGTTASILSSDLRELNVGQPHWEYQRDLEDRLTPRPYYLRALGSWHRARWRKPSACVSDLKHYRQRAQRGYSYRDLWNLDQHLARLREQAFLELRETTNGWPGDPLTFK